MKRRLRITALGFKKGWVGIFNRTTTDRNITLTKQNLGFIAFEESYNLVAAPKPFSLKDVWSGLLQSPTSILSESLLRVLHSSVFKCNNC